MALRGPFVFGLRSSVTSVSSSRSGKASDQLQNPNYLQQKTTAVVTVGIADPIYPSQTTQSAESQLLRCRGTTWIQVVSKHQHNTST